MNEELQNALATVITSAVEVASATGQFLENELPLVAEEVLRWAAVGGIASGLLLCAPFLICIAVAIYAYRSSPNVFAEGLTREQVTEILEKHNGLNLFWELRKDSDYGSRELDKYRVITDPTVAWGHLMVVAVFSSIMLFLGVPHFLDAAKALVAPRLYLLEYAAQLAGGS